MKKAALIVGIVTVVFSFVAAGDLRRQAENNPLDCTFYLLSKDKDSYFRTIERLALTYLELGNYPRTKKTIELLEDKSDRVENAVVVSTKLLKSGKPHEASNFLTFALENLDPDDLPDERTISGLIDELVLFNRLREAHKVIETVKGETEIEEIYIELLLSLIKYKKTSEALKLINQTYFPLVSKDDRSQAKRALIYAKLTQKEKALKILSEIGGNPFAGEDQIALENNRRFILPILLQTYLELGQAEQAFELWTRFGDQNLRFIDQLIDYRQSQRARELIERLDARQDESDSTGNHAVSVFLRLGEIEKAASIAQNISRDNDNYYQQEAWMKLADYFIEKRNLEKANQVLDLALQKAARIEFQHETEQSNGASSGTRKRNYLWNIYNRFMKLKEFDRAFLTINSINSTHSIAREFLAGKYLDFAKQQVKTLPKGKIFDLVSQSQNLVKDEDKYYSITIKARSAEIHALTGDKNTAVELLAQALNEARKSCCYEDDALIETGQIFEKYKLKPNRNLKEALRKILDTND